MDAADAAETAWEILLEIPAQQQTGGLLLQVGSCFALELTLASRTLHAYARDSGEQTMQDCGTLQLAPGAPGAAAGVFGSVLRRNFCRWKMSVCKCF